MSGRQLVALAALGAAGWALYRWGATTLPGDLVTPPLDLSWLTVDGFPGGPAPAGGYDQLTAARESAGNASAKNPRSSASGVYQFTRATWTKLGGAWGPDPSKPFGGLTPSIAEQEARFRQLTAQNTGGLARAGIAATNAALYAAHVLGLPTALRVLTSAPSVLLANLVGSKVMAANPQFRGFTVGDFISWAGRA